MKQLADLNRRILVSLAFGGLASLLIMFAAHPLVFIFLVVALSLLTAIGVWEYAQLALAKGLLPSTKLMMGIAILQVLSLYASLVFVDFPQLPIFVFALGLLAFFIHRFKDATDALVNVAVEFFSIVYIAAPMSMMLGVLYPIPHQGIPQEGRWWLFYLVVVTKITDMGAYFAGRLFGRHKLCPTLSPKKTVEGAIVGFASAVIASVFMRSLGGLFFSGNFHLTFVESIWLGMLIGSFGQVGDLAESLLKRDADVKDSNMLPGLGGVLDMVDSLLITTPIVYFFIRMH